MNILEYEAKLLLGERGLPIPFGKVITTVSEAAGVAQTIGQPVVLKAQIPAGGRMKSGGIRFAATPAQAATAAEALLGSQLLGFTVNTVLVETRVTIAQEIFIGVTYDADLRRPILLASPGGGIDIESSARVIRRPFSILGRVPEYPGREVAAELGFSGEDLLQLTTLLTRIARCFVEWDALLLEINPLILDSEGRWWVADAHLELDDDAAYRQQALLKRLPHSIQLAQPQSGFEQKALEIDRADHRGVAGRLVPFEGNLGLLIGGGGASLTAFDAALDAGLRPANYCEIGGNPSVWKISELTKLILSQPRVERLAVIMNVVSNTRVDLVARGVIKGVLELKQEPAKIIAAFRIPGSWEEEGQAILRHYGVPFFGRETSIDQVIEAIK